MWTKLDINEIHTCQIRGSLSRFATAARYLSSPAVSAVRTSRVRLIISLIYLLVIVPYSAIYAIATELRGNLGEMLGLANRTDGNGQYLFSGFQGSTKPFADTGSGVQYFGDEGLRMIQVSASRQLAVNESGREVFERIPASGGGNQSVFKTISNLIDILETPVVTPADKTALANGLRAAQTDLANALDNVLSTRASVGIRMKELDTLNDSGDDLSIQYKQQLAELQDVDYAKAISSLTQQQSYLEATQMAFIKVQGLSLFDFLR